MNFLISKQHKLVLLTAGFTLTALASSVGHAADADLQKQVDTLDEQVKILQRKLENSDEDAAKAKSENAVVTASDKGFGLKSADGNFEIKLKGLLQADAREFDKGDKGQYSTPGATIQAPNDFLIRRARPTLEGTVYGTYGFRITPDFAGSSTSLVDAYVDGNYDSAFKVRAGKFTSPLGIERLQSSGDTKFNELSLVSDFIPSRDVGVQVGGDLFAGTLNYAVGLFDGAVDAATGANNDTNTDKEAQARIFAQPFINNPGWFQGLGAGVAASRVDQKGGSATAADSSYPARTTELTSYNSIGQQAIFSFRKDGDVAKSSNPVTAETIDTVYANGQRTRLIPQAHYFYANFGVIAEYVREKQDLERDIGVATPTTVRQDSLYQTAHQLTFAWAITGEDESLKGIKPANVFDPGKGTWGAWELVARTSQLSFDRAAFEINGALANNSNNFADPTKSVRTANDVGLGVNWYPNKIVRVSLDYDHTSFKWGGGGTATSPLDRPDENVLIGRVQAAF
jgi:phosphate-selective porin OprO/OprP